MDVLSDVLATLRLESTVFAHGALAKPWGIRTEAHEDFSFHIVADGECVLDVDGEAPNEIGAGDVVIVARGHGHLASRRQENARDGARRISFDRRIRDARAFRARRAHRDEARVRMFSARGTAG